MIVVDEKKKIELSFFFDFRFEKIGWISSSFFSAARGRAVGGGEGEFFFEENGITE